MLRKDTLTLGLVAAVVVFGASFGMAAEPASPVDVNLLQGTPDHVVIEYAINDYTTDTVDIDGAKYVELKLGKESPIRIAGEPALPNVCRSIIIPDDAQMQVRVLASEFVDVPDMDIAPSKGIIYRTTDPADVPYTFGDVYDTDAFYPGPVAELRNPYILRNHRGTVIELNPFQYNPVTRTLRVYTSITIEVVAVGPGLVNVLQRIAPAMEVSHAFHTIYKNQFLNYGMVSRYVPLDEQGDMLIIAHDAWMANVQPLADFKTGRGINTTVVGVSTIGNNANLIKAYIQNVYDTSDLAFVLLVGDGAQVDTLSSAGGASDPSYSLLAGSDHYPEIMVGRFSAETAAHVDTQVQRTIEYETMPASTQAWFKKGMGIGSNQGPGDDGEMDYEHLDNIRLDLLAHEYTVVDQIYDPSGTASQVTTGLNNGRGIINYTGHGSTTAWSSTGFSNSNVNALQNNGMLPFICSVACVNGEFDGPTCFGEAWLRATNSGQPSGAICAYMSSINQSWNPPMVAQDEFVDLLMAEAYSSIGALMYAGSCLMIDEEGAGGEDMFDTWIIFGDPSVRVVQTCADAGMAALDAGSYACTDTATLRVADCGLNTSDSMVEMVTVAIDSTSETGVELVVLTETDAASAEFTGTIALDTTDAAGTLLVAAGDTITMTYIDADDGAGNTDVVVTATAGVDCTAPGIGNVQVIDIEPRGAVVTFDADEPARGTVHYGTNCGALNDSASGSGYATAVVVPMGSLQDATTYFFSVEAADEAGNASADDNGGACYTFTTPDIPNFFTELFEADNDLSGWSLTFIPNGTVDYYAGCAEEITALPTDPAGATNLNLTDDSFGTCNLTGMDFVTLYGTTYTTFYPCSNGYITFDHGETAYTETLGSHFALARIAGIFDDLNPASGGDVVWQQLEDRAVVTWNGVFEYGTTSPQTFQIEMFYSGDIRVSYLTVTVADGLAGLSEGNGQDPDYWETDLTAMGDCVPPDCNENGIPDPDDIAGGTSSDCNGNTVPDECDMTDGTSSDCNGNGIPDECDIADGTSEDCNGNASPDECDLAAGSSQDCNANTIPDECEISGGTAQDCNNNAVPDSCDVGGGASPDDNGNGIPDECELEAPAIVAEGSRYIAVTPQASELAVALHVTGDPAAAQIACVAAYVQADGTLSGTPVYLTPAEWGTVHVCSDMVVPGLGYAVKSEHPDGFVSSIQSATTWLWGDANNNGIVNFVDITLVVQGFQGVFTDATLQAVDLEPCEPNGVIDFNDINNDVRAFQGLGFEAEGCPDPCAP